MICYIGESKDEKFCKSFRQFDRSNVMMLGSQSEWCVNVWGGAHKNTR